MKDERNPSNTNFYCLKCSYRGCQLEFERKCSLINHLKSHLEINKISPIFFCINSNCNKLFCSKEHLEIHKSKATCSNCKSITGIESSEEQNIQKYFNEKFGDNLHKIFEKQDLMNNDLKSFSGKKCDLDGCNRLIMEERNIRKEDKSSR